MGLDNDIMLLAERIEEAKDDGPDAMGTSKIIDALEDLADRAEVVEVSCRRCDRKFRSLREVEYCTKSCELGGWPEGHTAVARA